MIVRTRMLLAAALAVVAILVASTQRSLAWPVRTTGPAHRLGRQQALDARVFRSRMGEDDAETVGTRRNRTGVS